MKAAIKGDYLFVKVENAFSDKKTKDKKRKGYGCSILQALADKYNGQMDTEVHNGIYSTCISVENIELDEKISPL